MLRWLKPFLTLTLIIAAKLALAGPQEDHALSPLELSPANFHLLRHATTTQVVENGLWVTVAEFDHHRLAYGAARGSRVPEWSRSFSLYTRPSEGGRGCKGGWIKHQMPELAIAMADEGCVTDVTGEPTLWALVRVLGWDSTTMSQVKVSNLDKDQHPENLRIEIWLHPSDWQNRPRHEALLDRLRAIGV